MRFGIAASSARTAELMLVATLHTAAAVATTIRAPPNPRVEVLAITTSRLTWVAALPSAPASTS
jgi:hypothetical protein